MYIRTPETGNLGSTTAARSKLYVRSILSGASESTGEAYCDCYELHKQATFLAISSYRLIKLIPIIEAVREIISQSASEILKMYILDLSPSAHPWTPLPSLAPHQIPRLLPLPPLQRAPPLRHPQILPVRIAPGDTILQSLEQAELITILSSPNGRPLCR